MSNERDPERERKRGDGREQVDTSHLDGVEDGCGCAEVWEHLSEGLGDDRENEDEPADSENRSATVTGASKS